MIHMRYWEEVCRPRVGNGPHPVEVGLMESHGMQSMSLRTLTDPPCPSGPGIQRIYPFAFLVYPRKRMGSPHKSNLE